MQWGRCVLTCMPKVIVRKHRNDARKIGLQRRTETKFVHLVRPPLSVNGTKRGTGHRIHATRDTLTALLCCLVTGLALTFVHRDTFELRAFLRLAISRYTFRHCPKAVCHKTDAVILALR